MSSLDKFPDWSVFSKRDVPITVEVAAPSSEAVALLQSRLADLTAAQAMTDQAHATRLDELAQQAVYATQLEATLERSKAKLEEAKLNKVYRALKIVKDQMLTALQQAGLEVMNPMGKSFDEVSEYVNVIGWRHHTDFTSEIVAEVVEPIILSQSILVRQGIVIMGAPLDQKPTNQKSEM